MILKQASSSSELLEAGELRWAVFVEEQGIPPELEIDDLDDTSTHVVAIDYNRIVGTGRITYSDKSLAILSRIAVAKSHRGKLIGSGIMEMLEEIARIRNFERLQLTPHFYLEEFYKRLGYNTISRNEGKVGDHLLIKMEKIIRPLAST